MKPGKIRYAVAHFDEELTLTGIDGARKGRPGWYRLIFDDQGREAFDGGPYQSAEAAMRIADQPNSTCERGEARSPVCPLPESGCDDSGSAADQPSVSDSDAPTATTPTIRPPR